jgi:hypothetical protein
VAAAYVMTGGALGARDAEIVEAVVPHPV